MSEINFSEVVRELNRWLYDDFWDYAFGTFDYVTNGEIELIIFNNSIEIFNSEDVNETFYSQFDETYWSDLPQDEFVEKCKIVYIDETQKYMEVFNKAKRQFKNKG